MPSQRRKQTPQPTGPSPDFSPISPAGAASVPSSVPVPVPAPPTADPPASQPRAAATPALDALALFPPDQAALLLHSGRPDPRWARKSLLARPAAWFTCHADRSVDFRLLGDAPPPPGVPSLTGRLWDDLRMLLNCPAMPGRWVGYFSYELARLLEPRKLSPRKPAHPAGPHATNPDPSRPGPAGDWPLLQLAWCPQIAEFPADQPPPAAAEPLCPPSPSRAAPAPIATDLKPDWTQQDHHLAARRALQYISAGDIFQVNLAQRFCGQLSLPGQQPIGPAHLRSLYARLAAISPAWFGAYLELPGGRVLASASPELFLELENGRVTTRPIKGTLPAARPAHELRESAKDAAELHMIVDLMRNDLGRVCSYGSVRVVQPRTIETHPTIHHAVATISGQLHPSCDVVDLLKATLPGGSITGAPKVRAMQIIDELEPAPRGPYTGCIGMIAKDQLLLNIAIRTLVIEPPQPESEPEPQLQLQPPAETQPPGASAPSARRPFSFHVGGAIVADSDPACEYQETLDKAAALLAALSAR